MSNTDKTMMTREIRDAEKFDRQAAERYHEDRELFIEPIHWKKFDQQEFIHQPYADIVQNLGNLSGKTVLECGCGTGVFSVILAKKGARHVDAFDISSKSIELAVRRAVMNDVADRVHFAALSIYDMQYEENHYDVIVGLNILHHVEIEKIVQKIHACLKPGGKAYFMDPFGNARWLEKIRLWVPVKVNEEDKTHWQEKLNYYKLEKFRTHFQNIQFREYHLLSRLDRVIHSSWLLRFIAMVDEWLLRHFRFMRKYARTIVVELAKA